MEEANLKRLHTIGFYLHDILEKAELDTVKRSVVARDSEREGGTNRWSAGSF